MLLRRLPDRIDLLKKVPLFSGLSRRHLGLIVRETERVNADRGKVLARQGALGREFLLIVDGSARVERDGKVIARLGAGDFFGEMSLIDKKPQSATVTAETAIDLLVVDARSFRNLLDTVPGLQKKILITLCERLRGADAALGSRN
ncbi:MAG: cyclic nucleotide-binding domain-containing protein [Dehalococcoidia bacterium]|nr:MAG: cyclic nucleotide-binding domain-containing protein [Dehalococcoidia bacterium]